MAASNTKFPKPKEVVQRTQSENTRKPLLKKDKPSTKKDKSRTLSRALSSINDYGAVIVTPPQEYDLEAAALSSDDDTPASSKSKTKTSAGPGAGQTDASIIIPLLPSEKESNAEAPVTIPLAGSAPETKNDKAIQEAERLLNELHDQSTPWTGWKTWISGAIALYGGGSTASTADFFANKLVNGDFAKAYLSDDARDAIHKATTPAAAIPAFFLSYNSNFSTWNRVLRALPYMTPEDFKRNALPLILTSLSAVVSMKAGLDSWKDADPALRWVLASGRALSAMSVNGLFATQLWKNIKGVKDTPVLNVIRGTHDLLKESAKTDPEQFINSLSNSRLFERLFNITSATSKDSKQNVNNIFQSLLAVLGDEVLEREEVKGGGSIKSKIVAYTLGITAAMPFFKTGQSVVPDLMKLSGPAALWTLGSVFGIGSLAVNTAICAINTADAIDKFANKECSWGECATLSLKLYFLLGNSLANFGMGLQYPSPVESEYLGWIEGIVNFFVYFAIGDMSIDNFFIKLSNGYHVHQKNILEGAKNAYQQEGGNLKTYYDSLSDDEKPILVKILVEYLKWSFESLTDFFNYSNQDIINAILTDQTQRNILTKAPAPLPTEELKDELSSDSADGAEYTVNYFPPSPRDGAGAAAASPERNDKANLSKSPSRAIPSRTGSVVTQGFLSRKVSQAAAAVLSPDALAPPMEFDRGRTTSGLRHRRPSSDHV